MEQTEVVTTEGITELGKLWAEEAATGIESIVCLELAEICTAAAGSTFGDPADAAVHHDDGDLELAAIDTVAATVTGVDFDHIFTAGASRNVVGIHVCNNDDNICFIECCFASVIAMENTDTLTIDGGVTMADA